MKIEEFSLSRKKAYQFWKQYVEACKSNPKDEILLDMKKTYNQLKSGRKVIDITQIFEKSGLTEKSEPRLAIASATSQTVYCKVSLNGNVLFQNKEFRTWESNFDEEKDVAIRNIFPEQPKENMDVEWNIDFKMIKAPVPKVPASLIPKPKSELKHYHVLWEVEKWKPVPPSDPYLLRRITPNMFVVVGSWLLTPLEKAVMRGRI